MRQSDVPTTRPAAEPSVEFAPRGTTPPDEVEREVERVVLKLAVARAVRIGRTLGLTRASALAVCERALCQLGPLTMLNAELLDQLFERAVVAAAQDDRWERLVLRARRSRRMSV